MIVRASALFLIAMASAFCYSGGSKLPVVTIPLRVVDSRTDRPIEECLVVPRYTSSSGVASGAGHGPGKMKHEFSIARPFVYRAGEEFRPYEGEASGVFVLGVWSGDSVSIDGVTVIVPGYRSLWVWGLWSRTEHTTLALEPLEPAVAVRDLAEIRGLLASDSVEGADRMRWSLGGDDPLHVRFTDVERGAALRFLDSADEAVGSGQDGLTNQ